MDGASKDRLMQLCELASTERDSKRLLELVEEINRVLDERELRLKAWRTGNSAETSQQF
jgi:hypothetical protein